MTIQVVQEKRPFGRSPPPILLAHPIEIDRERGDQIELPSEIRKWFEGSNRPNAALDTEKIEQLRKEREFVNIEAEATMPEVLKNEEKESAAAAKVENRLGRRPMQFEVLGPYDIQSQPPLHVGVLRVMLPGRGMLRMEMRQLRLIDASEDRRERNRVNDALGAPPGPVVGQRLRELGDFV